MRYMVTWNESAVNQLAEIWNDAQDQKAVTEAADRIDRALKRDAHTLGQDFDEDRIYSDPPLAVTFSVSPDDCRVWVWQVERV